MPIRKSSRIPAPTGERGMTLIELLVAMAVFIVLGSTLVMFLRVGINTWRVGEIRREAFERSSAILDQIEADISATYSDPSNGYEGKVDVIFLSDYDENGRQRVRFVRSLGGEMRHQITQTAGAWTGGIGEYDFIEDKVEMEEGIMKAPGGLQEIAYLMDPDSESEMLWRGMKSPIGGSTTIFSDDNLYRFEEDGETKPQRARPLASGVLYVEYNFWGQDTHSWSSDEDRGPQSWWDSTRGIMDDDSAADGSRHEWRDDVFPSRVQIVLVLRPARATRLAKLDRDIAAGDDEIRVDRADGYPDGAFQYVRIGNEWIQYESRDDRVLSGCRRGARGTEPAAHSKGTPVVYGSTFSRVVRIPGARTTEWGASR
ncbi:MAG: type II secretion system protein [Planctomycetota bacterium]